MSVEERAQELAAATGLKAVGRRVGGRYQGHVVAVKLGGALENYRVVFQMKTAPEAAAAIGPLVKDKEATKPLRRIQCVVGFDERASLLFFVLTPPAMTPKVEVLANDLATLAGIALRAGSKPTETCESCGTNPGQPVVVNDEPKTLCPACVQSLQGEFTQVRAAASAVRPNTAKGLAMGFLGALLGGVVWGVIGVLTGYVFGLVAIVTGLVVGWFVQRGAGRVTTPLMFAAVLLTLLSVFLGDLIAILIIILQEGGVPSLGLALAIYGLVLSEQPGPILLGYFFGLFGVFASARYLWRARKAQTPRLDIVTWP
ncbi:MAG: hypothetical protein A3K65_09410 [Euryarchaeota archaeon RBG_16_68_12]|nr:MAG: hypothetical protein A3K65_09410 [Euryarchaeota archaeon RBG_16_68_12]